ncbi:hypothetical protein HY489_02185 [Candidatus Woesearchaeota archaeon]|nr:hypothetical protein [Candidatus Woesearchaeota archaeon]
MRAIEIYFWCMMYLATYLLVSLVINLLTGWGDLVGITIIGLLLTLVLALILLWEAEREEREFEEMEPAVVVEEVPMVDSSFSNVREFFEMEVQDYENQEETSAEAERIINGVEPGPKMRTDLDLDGFDVLDDDVVG